MKKILISEDALGDLNDAFLILTGTEILAWGLLYRVFAC